MGFFSVSVAVVVVGVEKQNLNVWTQKSHKVFSSRPFDAVMSIFFVQLLGILQWLPVCLSVCLSASLKHSLVHLSGPLSGKRKWACDTDTKRKRKQKQ